MFGAYLAIAKYPVLRGHEREGFPGLRERQTDTLRRPQSTCSTMRPRLILPIVALVLGTSVWAQPKQSASLEELQKRQALEKAISTLNEMDVQLDRMIKGREAACQMSVGYPPFCTCILNDLPIAWTFSDYVAITTKSKEANGYSKLDLEMRQAYDKVSPIRDKCVRQINAAR